MWTQRGLWLLGRYPRAARGRVCVKTGGILRVSLSAETRGPGTIVRGDASHSAPSGQVQTGGAGGSFHFQSMSSTNGEHDLPLKPACKYVLQLRGDRAYCIQSEWASAARHRAHRVSSSPARLLMACWNIVQQRCVGPGHAGSRHGRRRPTADPVPGVPPSSAGARASSRVVHPLR